MGYVLQKIYYLHFLPCFSIPLTVFRVAGCTGTFEPHSGGFSNLHSGVGGGRDPIQFLNH